VDGTRNKALGIQAGRSDLVLYHQGKAYMIEMKTEKGKQKDGQPEWEAKIKAQGFQYHICRSLSEFQSLITCILK
jgi:hypothetical protein